MTESQLPSSSLADNFQPRTFFGGSTRIRSFMDSGTRQTQNTIEKSQNGVINIHLIEPDYEIESQKLLLAETPDYYNSCSKSDIQRIRDAQSKAAPMIKKLIDEVSAPYLAEIAFIQKSMEAKLKEAYEFSDKLNNNLQWTTNRLNTNANVKIKEESYFDSIDMGPRTPEQLHLKIEKPAAAVIHRNGNRMKRNKQQQTPEVLELMKLEYCRYNWPTPSRTPFNEGFLRHIWDVGPHLHQYYTKVSSDDEIQFKSFLRHWRNRTLRYKAIEALGPLYLATKPTAGSKKKVPLIKEAS